MSFARFSFSSLSSILVLGLFLLPGAATGQQSYAGVWREGTDGYALWVGDDWAGFEAKWNELSAQGLRLIDFETDLDGDAREYSGVYRAGNDGHFLWVGVIWDDFVTKWTELARNDLRLIDLETWVEGSQRRYAGVWREGTDGHFLWSGVSWNDFVAKWEENAKLGLRLIDLETWVSNGQRLYAGVWRAGTDGHFLWSGVSWNDFVAKWKENANLGLRLIDLETWVSNGQRRFAGVWRAGNDGYGLWVGVDFENFLARWHSWAGQDLRLIDLERYPGCSAECANQVVAPDSYDYLVTGDTWYRWPVDSDASGDYVRLSAVEFPDVKFMALPFSDALVERRGTWRYGNGDYHHAIDYSRDDVKTFAINASAAGEVVFVGWDNWSGNTVIVSHTVGGVPDAFRTLYMHLRDGADHDCDQAWVATVPMLNGQNLTDYKTHLTETGCTQNPGDRNLDASHWGTNAQAIPVTVGQTVATGQFLAWAGNTGPGGKRGSGGPNTHLHLFTARRDPSDNEYYFVDPYGIYAMPPCYPAQMGGTDTGICGRYPNLWGVMADTFESGDFRSWSRVVPTPPD